MDDNCAILVTTCDAYSDAWSPFFQLFHLMWPHCSYPIYLNTESKMYQDDILKVSTIHPNYLTDKKGKPISWSNRLKQALEKIESDYILFFLEDFFLQSCVREDVVADCIQWMREDSDVVFIDFYHDKIENEQIYRKEFSQIQRNNDWAINANCALWRKSFLKMILRDEDPWLFELNATARWRRTKYRIYTHRREFKPVFDYQFETINGDWSGIIKGKWLTSVPALFDKYGITVDYSKLGLIDPPDLRPRVREDHWLWHDVSKALKSPKFMIHYIKCTYDVARDKISRLKRKYLNR